MKRLLLLLALLPLVLQGQIRHQIGANFTVAYPMGEMNTNLQANWGLGFGLYYMGRPHEDTPIYLGADFNYTLYDKYSENLPPSFPGERLEQVINSNIIMTHLVMRVSPLDDISPVRPYLEGMVGAKFFYTRWKMTSYWDGNVEQIDANTDEASASLSYGLGGGIQIVPAENFAIDLRCNYLFGSETDYVRDVVRNPQTDMLEYNFGRTETHMLVPQLGVTFLF